MSMSILDRSWMNLRRSSSEFMNGVTDFLDWAFERGCKGEQILCPCAACKNRYWHFRKVVEDHLFAKGFVVGYERWIFHGERISTSTPDSSSNDETSNSYDDIDGLLHDTFRNIEDNVDHEGGVREGLSEEAKKFFRLVEEGKKELYPGCENFSKLSFVIRLYLLKTMHRLSNVAFLDLLDLLKEAFPFAQLPESFSKARKMIKDLGLGYEKIHACPNDCMLFWKDKVEADKCSVCGSSRWSNVVDGLTTGKSKKPAKVLRYCPLKPRLQRLFMHSETAAAMRWHATERPNDGNLRHPADGEAWKDFDSLHPSFASDPRNVRLGLSSDGFNPFRTMSISHSTWPVMLMNYNLSPWICMKPEYIMLSMIIPGPSSPGNDIDVYLQPLIDELNELWEIGAETYDAHTNQTFQMRAALLWTVSDFPALAMLSGWSTKGRLACPTCNYSTSSQYLKHSRKMCYMGHRAFLPPNHPYRRDKKSFNGAEDHRPAPAPLSGREVVEKLRDFNNVFGKGQKRKRTEGPWKKRSIFFQLPYWATNKLRHNLDVMHIEKNIFDSLLATLLDVVGKSKDHINSRYDLQVMGIRKELHPVKDNTNGKVYLAKSSFSMKPEEKKIFCTVFKNAKLPKGCASNISNRVEVEQMKISGYKSHDAHIMMQYLLQIAVRKSLPKNVAAVLIRLGNFFKAICSKVVKRADLEGLQAEIKEIECELEKIFPPTFFDIMEHLPIHLVDEIRLGGPNHLRHMYPMERELYEFKDLVRNRFNPEGSILEGFVAKEFLTFGSRYLHNGVKTRFSRYQTEDDEDVEEEQDDVSTVFSKVDHPVGNEKKTKGKPFKMDQQLSSEAH